MSSKLVYLRTIGSSLMRLVYSIAQVWRQRERSAWLRGGWDHARAPSGSTSYDRNDIGISAFATRNRSMMWMTAHSRLPCRIRPLLRIRSTLRPSARLRSLKLVRPGSGRLVAPPKASFRPLEEDAAGWAISSEVEKYRYSHIKGTDCKSIHERA